MNKKLSMGTAAALCLLTAGATCNVTLLACKNQMNQMMPGYVEQQKDYGRLMEIKGLIEEKYVGEYTEEDLMNMAAAGMVIGTGDRWSSYLTEEQVAESKRTMKGEMVGIGITVVQLTDGEEGVLITEVYDGSPADKAGLQRGDIILRAEDKSVEEDGYDAVLAAVRGEAGTMVKLTVLQDGETNELTIKRAEVQRTAVRGRLIDDHIGYIKIADFEGGADTQCEAVIADLLEQGADALIFDVRFNLGGLVGVMANMLDPLLPEGTIVTLKPKSTENAETDRETAYESDSNALGLPMAVIVNAQSISAAELFAAALQEYGVATVVGDPTIGKGFSQRLYVLSDGSGVNLSDQKYYTPKGKNLAGVGITPDVQVSLTEEQMRTFYAVKDADDAQLQAAIEAVTQEE